MMGDWADRDAINRNADELADVEQQQWTLQQTIDKQRGEIIQLRAMVMAVMEILVAANIADNETIQATAQRAYDALVPRPSLAIPAGGMHTAPSTHLTTCIKCKRSVPATSTTITGNGEVCDACV
jgi:hypothetical protein